jgi:phosphoglycerate-specific signal transduction histidine kinase
VVADARRAAEIIRRTCTMASRQTPQKVPLSLAEIVEESMVFLRHEFQSNEISVSLDLTPALSLIVGDRTQLQQVIVNLAMNAVQAYAEQAKELGRAPKFAGAIARRDSTIQAGPAHIHALSEMLRIVVLVTLRDASTLLIGVIRLLLGARPKSCC